MLILINNFLYCHGLICRCSEQLITSCSKGSFLECSPPTLEARVRFLAWTCQPQDLQFRMEMTQVKSRHKKLFLSSPQTQILGEIYFYKKSTFRKQFFNNKYNCYLLSLGGAISMQNFYWNNFFPGKLFGPYRCKNLRLNGGLQPSKSPRVRNFLNSYLNFSKKTKCEGVPTN